MRMVIVLWIVFVANGAGAFDPFSLAGIDRLERAAVPMALAFRDQTGREVNLAGLGGGKPMLLVPVLHDCPNICGVTLSGLAQAIQAQPFRAGTDFQIIAFGIDPAEGSAQAAQTIRELTARFPALADSGGLHAVTGPAASVKAVTDALGYRYAYDERLGQYAHVAASAALTADGRLGRWLYGLQPAPNDLRLALLEAGEGTVGNWSDQLLLLCYHYDPVTGRYGSLIWAVLQVAGVGTALALGGFITFAILRERRQNSGGRA